MGPRGTLVRGWRGWTLIRFNALTLQKLKVSDEPVEAKEDYTKFNTKDLKTGKVCVSGCGGIRCVACWQPGWQHVSKDVCRVDCTYTSDQESD